MSDDWKVMYNGTPMQMVEYQKKRIAELEAENARLGTYLDTEQLVTTKLTGENFNLNVKNAKLEAEVDALSALLED